MRVLLSCFQPFGGRKVNASWELVRRVPQELPGRTVAKVLLPVVHGKAWPILANAIADFRPDAVVAFGESPAKEVGLERTAINLRGKKRPLVPDGRSAYLTTLPLDRLGSVLKRRGIPAGPSLSAGTYLCNEVFYFLMAHNLARPFKKGAGFVHVPRFAHMRWPSIARIVAASL